MFVSGVKPDILTTDSIKDADFDASAFFCHCHEWELDDVIS